MSRHCRDHIHGGQRGNKKRKKERESRRRQHQCSSCCLYPCAVFRGMGRCLFVSCYPVIRCFGLDECRHSHHLHRHFF